MEKFEKKQLKLKTEIKSTQKLFSLSILLGLAFFSLNCGVKRPPAPLYTTPLPFEDSSGSSKASPTASPTPAPGKSS